MKSVAIELIPDTEAGGFTARIPDIPAYGEGETKEEAIADLKEALAAYVSVFGVEDALVRINTPVELRPIRSGLKEFSLAAWDPVAMPKLPRFTGKAMVKFLERKGFVVVRVSGSHHVMRRGSLRTVVPMHGNEQLKIGTLRGILRDTEMRLDDLIDR